MGRPQHCTNCVEFNRKKFGPRWGSNAMVVPGCSACHRRYEALEGKCEALEEQLRWMEKEREERAESHKTDLSNVEAMGQLLLENQKAGYDDAMLKLELTKTLELNQLKADYNIEHRKVMFLTISRDCHPGDVLLEPGDMPLGLRDLQISAHKIILGAKSDVLKKIFESGTLEKPGVAIQMDRTSHSVMEAVINFCYTAEISFGETVPVDQVLKLAHKYEIELLKDLCDSELCGKITIDNWPQMLRLSRTFAARKLQEEVNNYLKDHFDYLKDKMYETLEDSRPSN